MEAERRSTMSSLKGQLSNVEGSVKSMKVAVVVGSVLTVACLAAVFGVTVLANEVSKEVKVSNNTLVSKSGASVMTSSTTVTTSAPAEAKTVGWNTENGKVSAKVNAVVNKNGQMIYVCDEAVIVGGSQTVAYKKDSVLLSIVGQGVEKRSLSHPACTLAWYWCAMIASAIASASWWLIETIIDCTGLNEMFGWERDCPFDGPSAEMVEAPTQK